MFLRKLTSKLLPRSEAPHAPVHVGAFGKHPGWDDHIDDMGLETQLLIALKRMLYVEGIGGNIDSGAWEKLRDDQVLPGFDHVFLWKLGPEAIVGRLWSSRDGKGRSRYPMVVCAHCSSLPLNWVMTRAADALEQLRERCIASPTAEGVRAAVSGAQAELAAAVPAIPPRGGDTAVSPDGLFARLWPHQDLGPDGIGLTRILYQIDREMALFKKGTASPTRGGRDDQRARHLRVPACAPSAVEASHQWARVLATQLDPSTPILAIAPVAEGWVDVIVGEPGVAQLYVIRAARTTVPLTSEIPYNIEAQFVRTVRQMVAM